MIEPEETAVRNYIICDYMLAMVDKCLENLKAEPFPLKDFLVRAAQILHNSLFEEQQRARRYLRKHVIRISDEGGGNYFVRGLGWEEPYKIERSEALEEVKRRFGEYIQILNDGAASQ